MTVDIQPAQSGHARSILVLRHAAEDWLAARSIDQWRPREVSLTSIHEQVERGEFFVAKYPSSNSIVAAMRILWTDPVIWQHEDRFAGYVHSLMIDRAHAGTGLGRALLDWAAREVADAGADNLRLDCAESNSALRRYYRRMGFTEVGRRDFDNQWFGVTLFEKIVAR